MDSWQSNDRLSELPDSLILEILSLLDTRYAVRTTFLSKRWRDLWTIVPRLKFEYEHPDFICGVVAKWRGVKLVRLYLRLDYWSPTRDIDPWLLFAVEKQVEELHVGWLSRIFDITYCPPQCLYSCSSLTELDLSYCWFKIEGTVHWNRLKSLCIFVNHLGDDAMNKLLLGAPRMEEMSLFIYEIDEDLCIRSISLKNLKIDCKDRKAILRIWAPNLLTLEIGENVIGGGDCLFYVPSLTEAFFTYVNDRPSSPLPLESFYQILRSICHVKEVTFSQLHIESLLDMKKKDKDLQFPNVEFLIQEWDESEYYLLDLLGLLEMFPELKIFIFHQHKDLYIFNPIVEMTLPRPSLLHLNTIEITWSAEDPSIIQSIEFLLQNAPFLHKMVFHLVYDTDNHELFLMVEEKVRSMPRSSPTVELIIIEHVVDESKS